MLRSVTAVVSRSVRGFAVSASLGADATASSLPISTDHVAVAVAAPNVYHVRLNRPDRRNAFTFDTFAQLKQVFDSLALEPECRAIVLSGEGKSFTAGLDLKEAAPVRSYLSGLDVKLQMLAGVVMDDSIDPARRARKMQHTITMCQDGITSLEKCPKPIIAAIHAHCIGAGVDLVTACDIRYSSTGAVFSIREVQVGLAADVGTLNRIQKLVGNDSLTRELALTARDFTAEEAKEYGLVSRILRSQEECLEEALKTAVTIASHSPVAVQGTKVVLNYARDHPISDSLSYVKLWNQSQLLTEDLLKSATASMSKQKAVFENVD